MYGSWTPLRRRSQAPASIDATSIISSCKTLPMTDLSMPDHLPLVAELNIEYAVQTLHACNNVPPWLDWE